ncbi:MAG TPA: SxtJ family membrane protein [Gammaproteobacteria bacterium]|jgi:hypothetical protein|nr:SxtJ family membrane protein [Gammaproteobacteria bacterium]
MVNVHSIPELDRNGLRRFALTTGGIVAVLFGLFFPWLLERSIPIWPWVVAGVLVAWGLIAPSSLRPVYRGWMIFGLLLNKVMSPLIMSLLFFLAITPMGLVRRMFGHAVPKHRDAAAKSYRIASKKANPEDLERPF